MNPTPIAESGRNPSQKEVTRRHFFSFTGIGAFLAAFGGMVGSFLEFLHPHVLFEPPTSFVAGRPEDYAVDSITPDYAEKVYIVRTRQGFSALSAVCTHLGCITRWVEEENLVECPCHGSKFGRDGSLKQGPAPRPLTPLLITLKDGQLIVDKAAAVNADYVLQV